MSARSLHLPISSTLAGLLLSAGTLVAQQPLGSLPATAPTQGSSAGMTAPLAATAPQRSGSSGHAAQVSCDGGLLEIRAQNSSLNGILRAIARCTGMRITGTVPEQKVFGNYGPGAPATILATLLDGTGSNMLLQETSADGPAQLILTPRTGAPTSPAQAIAMDAGNDGDDDSGPPMTGPGNAYRPDGARPPIRQPMAPGMRQGNGPPAVLPSGSSLIGPQPIPQPINNVNGSPNNTSPTASTYPTTNSVPLDSLATPSTTPPANGIVDAPNPPPAGSDTAAALNGAPKGTPGTTNISPSDTSDTSTPGATNTTVPAANTDQSSPAPAATDLTPEQIFQQLQQRQQQQQQQQQQNSPQ